MRLEMVAQRRQTAGNRPLRAEVGPCILPGAGALCEESQLHHAGTGVGL